ncbi:MAG TPA: DNA-formamidopyrimidine glycosylase family protein, partial [Acidimicrobiia bacterium]
MPELPDITVYIEALERHALDHAVTAVRIASPSVLRTFDPSHDAPVGAVLTGLRRVGKRIVMTFPNDLHLV